MNSVDHCKKLGSAITRPDGGSTLVLMRILKEWYNEDQALKAEKIDALEQTMISDEQGSEGRYGTMTVQRRGSK